MARTSSGSGSSMCANIAGFLEYIKNFDFWGFGDIDLIYGCNTIDEESAKYLLQTIANCISPSFGKSLRIEILNIWEKQTI